MKLKEFIESYNKYIGKKYPEQFTICYRPFTDPELIYYCEKDVIKNIIQSDYWKMIKDKSICEWMVVDSEIIVRIEE